MFFESQRVSLSLMMFVIALFPLLYVWVFKRMGIHRYRNTYVKKMFYRKIQSSPRIVLASTMGNYTFNNTIISSVIISAFTYEIGRYPAMFLVILLSLWVLIAIRVMRNIHIVIFVTVSSVYVYNALLDSCTVINIDANIEATVVTHTLTQTLAINGDEVCRGLELLNSFELASEINIIAKE